MTPLLELVHHMDKLLDIRNVPDYANALNGLQLESRRDIVKIAAAVDLSTRTINGTVDAGANLMIVHHGMFWSGLQSLRGPAYARIKTLIENDIAVYAVHLPLDRHPLYGNNVLLARTLGLVPTSEFARYKTISIGVRGEAHIPTAELYEKASAFAREHGGVARSTPIDAHQRTTTWAICSGGGASTDTLREAAESGVDTLIVGEGPHHTAVDANELGVTVIYAGHYATETLGVQALSAAVAERYGTPWVFIEAPTGL